MARSRLTTGTQYSGRRPYARLEPVEELLTDLVRLVVLVEADPADHGVPHDLVDPRVLERGAHEPGRVPVRARQHGGFDEHDAEAEAAVHERSRAWRRAAACAARADVLGGLGDPLLGDDPDALARRTPCGSCAMYDSPMSDCSMSTPTVVDGRAWRSAAAQKIGSSVIEPLRQRERPLPQPLLRAGDADRRHLEPLLDRLASSARRCR